MNRFIKLTFPRITLKYVCTEGERRGKNKESKTTEPKNIYWFIQHRSSSHFIVLSSFESFNGATPVVGFFLRVIKLNSRPFHTYAYCIATCTCNVMHQVQSLTLF